jgi:hypothetical protein
MTETETKLDPSHHIFRHIKKTWMDGGFVDPAAFRLRKEESGRFEEGLSVNWVEYFQKATPQEAIAPLRDTLVKKGRAVGGESKFALLNVGTAKAAAATYTPVAIILDAEPNDPSHSLVKGYEADNDQVAEELAKVVIDTYPAKS